MIRLQDRNERLLSIAEAAEIFGCDRSTVYRYVKKGWGGHRLEVVTVRGRQRTTLAAINDFINAGVETETTTDEVDLHGVFGNETGASATGSTKGKSRTR
jgi:predicted transcriptional regulator